MLIVLIIAVISQHSCSLEDGVDSDGCVKAHSQIRYAMYEMDRSGFARRLTFSVVAAAPRGYCFAGLEVK